MLESKKSIGDNEYTIMAEIAENQGVTQRELSRKLGVSLSTVNVLVNKMIREGLIKMTQISQKQVLYMLTPAGMMEKAGKAVNYLKIHYRAICEMKKKIKSVILELASHHDIMFVIINNDEIGEILLTVINELNISHNEVRILILHNMLELSIGEAKSPVIINMLADSKQLIDYMSLNYIKIINVAEYI